jgi:hypothetical protein
MVALVALVAPFAITVICTKIASGTSAEFGAYIKSETVKWAKVIKISEGIQDFVFSEFVRRC